MGGNIFNYIFPILPVLTRRERKKERDLVSYRLIQTNIIFSTMCGCYHRAGRQHRPELSPGQPSCSAGPCMGWPPRRAGDNLSSY